MVSMADIDEVEEWLITQALETPHVPEMFAELCARLRSCGLPVDRAVLAWATLHPLIDAETVEWRPAAGFTHETFKHKQIESEGWLRSPMRAVLTQNLSQIRRPLQGANAVLDFPLCVELAASGFTDYLVAATHFQLPAIARNQGNTGILVSWATREEGGFSERHLKAIHYIQKRLAISARANLEAQITRNVAETYLGRWAGSRVLKGQICHGDGQKLKAVIFYSDIRGSTGIAESLGADRYLKFLNAYFEATASPILDHEGEILDFIGDAVLGIFPIENDDLETAIRRALAATGQSRQRIRQLNDAPNALAPLKAGIALTVGDVMFGNIGIPNRLSFSVIGQTVNVAARIEALTKTVKRDVLLTEDIAALIPDLCDPVGAFELDGFSQPRPFFALKP